MLVKALKTMSIPTHSLIKGKIYDIRSKTALELIEKKIVKKPTKKEKESLNEL